MTVLAALLAAGAGSRYAGPEHKLDAQLGDGRTVFAHACAAWLACGADHLALVTGASRLAVPDGVTELHNPNWADGQATSVACVLDHAAALIGAGIPVDAVVIGLADQPFVPAAAWQTVIAAPGDAVIVVATYGGVRGPHPVRLGRPVWPLLPRIGDDVGRTVLRAHPEWVTEVPCPGTPADIDTLEDLARWTSS